MRKEEAGKRERERAWVEMNQANLQSKVSKDWSFEKPDQFIKLYKKLDVYVFFYQ